MDKPRLILSVAGSGKTSHLVEKLNVKSRALLVTYTDNNVEHLKQSVIRKFGYIPSGITVLSYFSFLYSFCYKPFLSLVCPSRGLTFERAEINNYYSSDSKEYYVCSNGLLYSNRLALLIKNTCLPDVVMRLDKYYDSFYIDEVQDMAGYDFDLIVSLKTTKCSRLYVGDFFQHSVDSSRSGTKNQNLHKDYTNYKAAFVKEGFDVDENTLSRTYRCGPAICDFVTRNLGIQIASNKTDDLSIIELVEDHGRINEIIENPFIIKLLYKESYKYKCISMNWGESKGLDCYQDVCVILNKKTYEYMRKGMLDKLSSVTKNKLYVALTRAHRNVYLIRESDILQFRFAS